MPAEFGPLDIDACDKEPIHIPGSIQPHGVLLALNPASWQIEQAAGDTLALFGLAPQDLLGCSLDACFSPDRIKRLRDAVQAQQQMSRSVPHLDADGEPGAQRLDAVVYNSDGVVVIEVEPARTDDRDDTIAIIRAMEWYVQGASSVSDICQAVVEAVQTATGFDRVMLYRFLPNGTGVVEAEARAHDAESFLGLHYPASDIPRQARALYPHNWLRVIPDITYTPAPICPAINPTTGLPLDLSQSALRSVSPIHLQYLANMGVAASLSISILRYGNLWGLIACHHNTPRHVPLRLRVACELFAEMSSLRLQSQLSAEELSGRLAAKSTLESLVLRLPPEADLADGLTRLRPNLLDLIPAEAVTLWFSGRATSIGRPPSPRQIYELVDWLNTRAEGVFITDNLPGLYPPALDYADVASGLMAVSLSKVPRDYVLWFRPEATRSVTWAGNPNKAVEPADASTPLTPRASFAAWREQIRLHSQPWQPAELEAAISLRMTLLEVVLQRMDVFAKEQAAARRHQDMLMAELDHRVKNLLATIQALVMQSRSEQDTLDSFLHVFNGRLHAMSRAHSLLTKSRWEGADLHALICEEMAPIIGEDRAAATSAGQGTVVLRPKAALALCLAVHELTTNAAKYGALSTPQGRVHITWHIEHQDARKLVITWREAGGPPVVPPARTGFGLTLIESCLAYELGGHVVVDLRTDGVVCTLALPWDQIAFSSGQQFDTQAKRLAGGPTLQNARILLVEDNALIAMTISRLIGQLGGTVVGPCPRLADALPLAETAAIDIAVLDIDLDGTMVWPVADILQARGIPFIFASGFDADLVRPPRLAGYSVIGKPFQNKDIEATILRHLRPA